MDPEIYLKVEMLENGDQSKSTYDFEQVGTSRGFGNEDSGSPMATSVWTNQATKCMLSEYRCLHKQLGESIKNKTALWKVIQAVMKQKGYCFSAEQVQNKYKTVLRQYKAFKNKNKTGKITCKYADEMDGIFGNSQTVEPVYILGGNDNSYLPESSEESDKCHSPAPPVLTSSVRSTKGKPSTIVEELQKLRNQIACNHKEKMRTQKQFHENYERRTAVIQEKNKLLYKLLKEMISKK